MVYHKIRRHGQTFYQAFDSSTGYYETNTWTEEALIAKQLDHTIDREVEIHDEEAAKAIHMIPDTILRKRVKDYVTYLEIMLDMHV